MRKLLKIVAELTRAMRLGLRPDGADLRQAAQHYPNDAALEAWIKNPPAFKPGTKMPPWEGVIEESEYPALIAYVKELGAKK